MKEYPTAIPGKESIDRREFLQRAGVVALGAAALKLSPLALAAAEFEALQLKHISSEDAGVLAQVSRLLFPHDALEQSVYLGVVRDIDNDLAAGQAPAELLREIAGMLNEKAGGDWLSSGNEKQVAILKSLEGSELFKYLHGRSLNTLYQDPVVWALLGYEGSSVEHGGYLHRGFNDIDWLE